MFDLHVHTAPDVIPRLATDREMVALCHAAGLEGLVLKGHYDSTVGRAALLHTTDLEVYGGLVLNSTVGGFNPLAVAAQLSMGARIIWLPTEDAHTQASAGLPRFCSGQRGMQTRTYAAPPVDWSSETDLRRIFALIADADAVLATGHLSAAEAA